MNICTMSAYKAISFSQILFVIPYKAISFSQILFVIPVKLLSSFVPLSKVESRNCPGKHLKFSQFYEL